MRTVSSSTADYLYLVVCDVVPSTLQGSKLIAKNWIVLGIAVAVILAYTLGIPPSFNAEYTKNTQNSVSENNCGNSEYEFNGQSPSE